MLSQLPLPHWQDGNPSSSFTQLRRAQGGESRRELLLALKGLQLYRERANPNKKKEVSLQEVVGASSEWAAGRSAALWEGAAGLSSPAPCVWTGCADPGQAGGCPAGEPGCSDSPQPRTQARGREAEVPLQAPSLSTAMQQSVLVMLFYSSPSKLLFSTLICASALLPPPAQAARV